MKEDLLMEHISLNRFSTHPASFRDPSGFIFTQEGKTYRQVNMAYKAHYEHLVTSKLYQILIDKNWLIKHEEFDCSNNGYKVLLPTQLSFISYPYEWSFSQLKDAALLTLNIQEVALEHGMVLKDASSYNIQFAQGTPVFIDTLSFEIYQKNSPWSAYRQFCQHFLAPLALMAKTDIRLNQLLKIYLDGLPLDLASHLLPKTSWINVGLLTHIHLHAKMQKSYSKTSSPQDSKPKRTAELSKKGLIGIIHSLRSCIEKLDWKPHGTEWADYYQATNYSDSSLEEKQNIIKRYLQLTQPKTVWDLGANTGYFSRLASEAGVQIVAFDIDPAAVESHYRASKNAAKAGPLPLLLDLTNPTPGIGWANTERNSFLNRGPVDCIMALALIHHLAIASNVPLDYIAALFAKITQYLIIEFVPKSDSQVQRLLRSRKDIFDDYSHEGFKRAFEAYFSLESMEPILGSERVLYLMKVKS